MKQIHGAKIIFEQLIISQLAEKFPLHVGEV
jgi:hypothetical protein